MVELPFCKFKANPREIFTKYQGETIVIRHRMGYEFRFEVKDVLKEEMEMEGKELHRCVLCCAIRKVLFVPNKLLGPNYYCYECRKKHNLYKEYGKGSGRVKNKVL